MEARLDSNTDALAELIPPSSNCAVYKDCLVVLLSLSVYTVHQKQLKMVVKKNKLVIMHSAVAINQGSPLLVLHPSLFKNAGFKMGQKIGCAVCTPKIRNVFSFETVLFICIIYKAK